MDSTNPTPQSIIKTMSLIYWGLFLSLIAMIGLSAFFVSNIGPFIEDSKQSSYIVSIVMIFLLITLAPMSFIIPQRMIAAIDPLLPLIKKLGIYQSATLIRFVLMDFAGILIAVGFMATGEMHMIYMQLIVLLFFLIFKPSPFKIASDLSLDENEKDQLYN